VPPGGDARNALREWGWSGRHEVMKRRHEMRGRSNAGRVSAFRDWLRKHAAEYKDREDVAKECEKLFKKARRQTFDAIGEMRRYDMLPRGIFPRKAAALVSVKRKPMGGRRMLRLSVDVSDIKKEYDEESKIMDGLKTLGTRLIKDNDFRMELEVPIDRWKVVSGLPRFVDYKKELKGKRFRGLYWGNQDVIKELSKTIAML
jgi:hypothetical protein